MSKGQQLVKASMGRLRAFILQMPGTKQNKAEVSVQQVIYKRMQSVQEEEGLLSLAQALDNKLSFYRLAYPGIEERVGEEEDALDINLSFYLSAQQGQEDEVEKSESGEHFRMEGGEVKKGKAAPRPSVDVSNWFAANVDPEDLRKHRELLDRQHYRGPVWEGQKVTSVVDHQGDWSKGVAEELKDQSTPEEKQQRQKMEELGDDGFDLVKR